MEQPARWVRDIRELPPENGWRRYEPDGPARQVTEMVTTAVVVWVVAQIKATDEQGWATDWDLGGVFTTEDKARVACTAPSDAMWPMQLDQALNRQTAEPPGITYPAATDHATETG